MLLLTLAVCFGFAALFERPLGRFRAALRAAAEKRRRAGDTAQEV
jgi:hypothetical protein